MPSTTNGHDLMPPTTPPTELSQYFEKIDVARFGPFMALLAIGSVTVGLAQKNVEAIALVYVEN